jgi:hypothetical protein
LAVWLLDCMHVPCAEKQKMPDGITDIPIHMVFLKKILGELMYLVHCTHILVSTSTTKNAL